MKVKRKYEKPSMKVHVLKQRARLLVGSNPAPTSASIDDYVEDDTFSW
jgi:hypothetical protein